MTPESPSYKDVGVCQHSETAIAFNFLKLLSARRNWVSGINSVISRNLVQLQGGTIEVESELGRGSSCLYLSVA